MHPHGNFLSSVALFVWIPVALWIARRWPPAKSAALLFLLPLMFLPERIGFKLPGLPVFDKLYVATFWLLIAVLLFHRPRLATVELSKWIKLAIALLLGGSLFTVFLNTSPVVHGPVYLPGHTPYDVVHFMSAKTLEHLLPFILASAMFSSPRDLRVFFRVLVGSALAYSLLQIVELLLSPQLHNWVYGFYQHHFRQTMRGSGYRPMVFMTHGLAVAMFTAAGVLAAAGLHKAKVKVFRIPAGWALVYLWIILFASKSLAAFLYTLIGVPLILLATPKIQLRVATLLAIAMLVYPAARGAGLVPVEDIEDWVAAQYGEERASSLMARFINEEALLERANEKPVFGWGGECRGCIFDPEDGEKTSVSDGDWIITLGAFGWVGFLGKYLLLLLPILGAGARLKHVRRMSDRRLLSALALIVAFSMVDLLPNGNFNYLVFVFSGVLMGCSTGILRHQAVQRARRGGKNANPAALAAEA